MLTRRLTICALALFGAVALTCCTPDVSPRVRVEGGVPVIAICADVVASDIEVHVGRDGTDPMDGGVYWRVEGEHELLAGDSITSGAVPVGMTETVRLGSFAPATDDLIVTIDPVDPEEEIQTTWLGAGAISSDRWSNGNAVIDPCGN